MSDIPPLEKEFVVNAYDNIATDFSGTRYKAWPSTIEFVNELAPGARVLEVGCGNGKNMFRKDVIFEGIDISEKLVKICLNKGLCVKVGDNCNLPYDDNSFNAILSIAVIHHMSTQDRRQKAIEELLRVSKENAKIMIECWADTEPKFLTSQTIVNAHDKFVTFKNKDRSEYKRYYHFFTKETFTQLMTTQFNGFKLSGNIYNESNNWIFIGSKEKV